MRRGTEGDDEFLPQRLYFIRYCTDISKRELLHSGPALATYRLLPVGVVCFVDIMLSIFSLLCLSCFYYSSAWRGPATCQSL